MANGFLQQDVTQPLLRFSNSEERACVYFDDDDDEDDESDNNDVDDDSHMARTKRRGRKRGRKGKRGRRSRGAKGVRVNKGSVALRVKGFPGVQHLRASALVRHVPAVKLRAAAKKVLGRAPRKASRRGRKRGRKAIGKRRQKR